MTSCSLAISHHAEKLQVFLALALKDELLAQPPEEVPQPPGEIATTSAEYTMYKIKSLSEHRKVIEVPRTEEDLRLEQDLDEADESQWQQVGTTRVPKYMLALQVTKPDMPEEFNKKVFKLIELAQDDKRKRRAGAQWCPWF